MLSIMYVSCYTYKSLWEPFFKLKKKYIGDDIITYFCTDEIKDYELKADNSKILNFGRKSNFSLHGNYYERYLYYLNNIDSEYILYFYDDMFPLAEVNIDRIHKFIDIMKNNNDIKIIKLSSHSFPFNDGTLVSFNDEQFIKANNKSDHYIMNVQPILIKRTFFIDLINYCILNNTLGYQNGGMEVYGTEYFRNNPSFICLRTIDDIIKVNDGAGIVKSGYMTNETKNMLKDKEDIYIETYNNLIFKLTKDEYDNLGDKLKGDYADLGINVIL